MPQEPPADPFANVLWTDALDLPLEGAGFADVAAPFDRLPARAEGLVRDDVWRLSRCPAGLSVRFVSDATDLFARWSLPDGTDLPHDDLAIQFAGLDGYGRDPGGPWRWVGAVSPWKLPTADARFNGTELDGQLREYRVYLPLRCQPTKIEIGVPAACVLEAPPADPRRAVVVYGTSICHGARASRPGMCWPSVLGRRLDRTVINLGFSGQGRLDPELAPLLAELDPAAYVLDCLPNIGPTDVRERTGPFVRTLRAAHPDTPILLHGDRRFGDAAFQPLRETTRRHKNAALWEAFRGLAGVPGVYLLTPPSWFGEDNEGTNDGSHCTDLGAMRLVEQTLPVLQRILADGRPKDPQP